MKQITKIRKAVCTMANELRKAGYSLSKAFKKAWSRIKLSMTIRAEGTTFRNTQERLAFLKRFNPADLSVTLEREPENRYLCRLAAIRRIKETPAYNTESGRGKN